MLSPDGAQLSDLAPDDRDVLQVWVRTLAKNNDRCLSHAKRPIQYYGWLWDSSGIFWAQDNGGDENWHIHAIDVQSGNIRDLTPWQGVRCHLPIMKSAKYPAEMLVMLNVRDRKLMDVWRIDLRTGAATLEIENPGDVTWWTADNELVVRACHGYTAEGGFEVRVRPDARSAWYTLLKTSRDEEAAPLGFSQDGRELFLKSSVACDTMRVLAIDLASGVEREVACFDGFDAEEVLIHPTRHVVEAVAFAPARIRWRVVDPAIEADFEAIAQLDDGDSYVVSRDLDDRKWVVVFVSPHRPLRYVLWERETKRSTFLFSHTPELENVQLAEMQPIKYRARDGLEVHGYLTLPPGISPRNLPLVLHPHGGPWFRNYWIFDVWTQLLANRGYAVLQPNFRGSTGYGRRYLHAGDRQWALAMQDDLTDAVQWAIAEGIADSRRVAIFGASYGGYAALAGASFTPDLYRCAIDLCGPSNVATCIRSFAPYWGMTAIWNARVGNPDDAADREMLANASPLFAADRIKIPLLIAQGANDVRVIRSESEQIIAAIEKNDGRAIYVLYPDEGHGLLLPQNNMDFMARVERFLAEHLGGRYQEMAGERIPESSAIVKMIGQ